MTTYSPLFKIDKPHFHTNSGTLATGCKLYVYDAGTDTPATVYGDPEGNTAYTNPIVLDGRGEPAMQGIYADVSKSYKIVFKNGYDSTIWSMDGVKCGGIGDITINNGIFFVEYGVTTRAQIREAVESGLVPVLKASNPNFVWHAFPAELQPTGASIVTTYEFSTPMKYDGTFLVYRLNTSGEWSVKPMLAQVSEDK